MMESHERRFFDADLPSPDPSSSLLEEEIHPSSSHGWQIWQEDINPEEDDPEQLIDCTYVDHQLLSAAIQTAIDGEPFDVDA